MTRAFMSKNPPAAGASGGARPLPATFFVPEFLRFDEDELNILMHVLRDSLCTQLYMLIKGHCVFTTGEYLGTYARLMELCTPPAPERGRRRYQPSYETVRRALRDLEAHQLIERSDANAPQGQLRLWVRKFKNKPAPVKLANRV